MVKTRSTKIATATAVVALAAGSLAGCGTVEFSKTLSSCAPYYAAPSSFGRFTAEQAGHGAPLFWGAYPNANYQGTWYYVRVYAGGRVVDTKNQYYAPHASLNAATTLKYSGQEFSLVGKVTRGSQVVLEFDLNCRIA